MSWVTTSKGRRWKGDDGRLYASAYAELQAKQNAPGSTYFEQLTGTSFVKPLARALDPSGLVSAVSSGFNQLARSAQAAVDPAEAYRQDWERQNQGDTSRRALLSKVGDPGRSSPIVSGLDERGGVDRTQSDIYKQYAFTPSGQFERYFKTPEMDQYFGAASRGATAPKDVEAMQALAGKTVAPGKTPEELSAFYRAESAMGRAQMPEIQKQLGYAEGSALAKWAEANPMLAQRLYAKEMGKREAAGQVTPGITYAGAPSSIGDANFAVAANAVPAPWDTQGNKVSAPFADVKDSQFAYTTGEGMPALPTTFGQRAEELISAVKRDRGML